MKYAIVFSSHTGNTAKLAETLRNTLPGEDCAYFGAPDEKARIAPVIFVGFWTDKGSCDEVAKDFLKTLRNQRVFLFGTAGFGGSPAYFEKVLAAATGNLDASVQIVGSFMCQGKMSVSVLERYERMLAEGCDTTRIQGMIDNFHAAASHPNPSDFEAMGQAADACFRGLAGSRQ